DDPPDPQRDPRRPPGRDARAARDHRADAPRLRRARLRRGVDADARVRLGAGARGRGRQRPCGLPHVRRARRGADAALGHDRPDRAARRHAIRDRRAPAALRVLRARLPRRAPPARPAARAAAGRDRAHRRARAGGHRRGADRALPRARRHRPARLPDRAGQRLAVPEAHGRVRRARLRSGRPAGPPRGPRSCRSRTAHRRGAPGPASAVRRFDAWWRRGARQRSRPAAAAAVGDAQRRRPRAGHLRPRARAVPRLLHGRGVRGLRPGRRRADRPGWALRRPARALRAPAARRRLRRRRRPAAHRAGRHRARQGRPAGDGAAV
ncbi:MAG: ATP phosphoribosyltransferase regulatory subunit, partial [uncultured Solirubrobacteraceae bacterium]